MRDDINLLNLMNGMNYSIHQLAHLGRYAREAEDARRREEKPFDAEASMRYRNTLAEIAAALERGGEPDGAALNTAWRLRGQVLPGKNLMGPAPGRDPFQGIGRLVRATREILFESQQQVLVDYKPCLIPPKNLKDPVRVGQANDNSAALGALQRFRKIPEPLWRNERGEIVERSLAGLEKFQGKFPPEEREEKKKALAALIDRVRALGDVDFELQKEDLAGEFEKFARQKQLEEHLAEAVGDNAVLAGKIRSIVLHSRAAPLYEARLKQLQDISAGKPVDLDKISPAPNCKDGGCAIKEGRR